MEFYNQGGHATCYSPYGEHIYLWNGKPIAQISSSKAYSMAGRFLGWLDKGWLYDCSNCPAMFMASATGGPIKPVRSVKPVKSVRQVRPVKGVKELPPLRTPKGRFWSEYIGENYFHQ